jgi:hypothetical protein
MVEKYSTSVVGRGGREALTIVGRRYGVMVKVSQIVGILLVLLIGISADVAAQGGPPPLPSEFSFSGFTYDLSKKPLNGTNVTIEVYQFVEGQPPALINSYSNLSNESGFFNITGIEVNESYMYKPVLRYYNGTKVTYIGQSLPPFPVFELLDLGIINFFLRPAATLNITAFGDEMELENMATGISYPLPDTYLTELEWLNDYPGWAYINASGSIVVLDPNFNPQFSYPLQPIIINPTALYYNGGNITYVANLTTVVEFYLNNGSIINIYDISVRGYFNLTGLEYNPDDGNYYISGIIPGNATIDVYDSSFNLIANPVLGNIPFGKLARHKGFWYMAFYDTYDATYALVKYDDYWSPMWRWTFPSSVEGIAHNGYSWYYASTETNNVTQVTLTDGGIKRFYYMIKDTKLGYPVAEYFSGDMVQQATIYVPADRNYSIMIYPDRAMPVSYNLNNISAYGPSPKIDIPFNLTEKMIWVSGYVNTSSGSNFEDLKVVPYLLEPGNMVFSAHPMPYNMSAWREPFGTFSDQYDPSIGFYNITLIGSAMGADMLLFVTAKNGSVYYGGFRNISLTASDSDVTDFNLTLQQLLGVEANITMDNAADFSQKVNIPTMKKSFRLQNATGATPRNAFVEFTVDYTPFFPESVKFSWMIDVGESDNGLFSLPVINADVREINIYSPDFAPMKTSLKASELSANPVNITLRPFDPGAIEGEEFPDLFLDLLVSNATCNVPKPPIGCSLVPAEVNESEFNPLTVIMGGGDISFRMKKLSNNITVHYSHVDLLASGPPDALFDSSSNETVVDGTIAEAWRFGSTGPEIYESVLLGMPYNESKYPDYYNFSVRIGYFYDEDWNVIWNISANTTSEIPEDYSDYLSPEYNAYVNISKPPMPCSKTDQTSTCYVDTLANMVWIKIPHFSGVAPQVLASDTKAPIVDVVYNPSPVEYGSEANLTVNVTEDSPDTLKVWRNGTLIYDGSYSGGVPFNISIYTGQLGVYNYTIWANDTAGNSNSTVAWVTVQDTIAPAINTVSLNTTIAKQGDPVLINATVIDTGVGVDIVNILVNGVSQAVTPNPPYYTAVYIAGSADGVFIVNVTANDSEGNFNYNDTQTITVDNTPPEALAYESPTPADGASVSGTQIINVSASDSGVGLDSIEIFVDGVSVQVCTSSPCVYSWDTTKMSDGSHTFNATANDTLGNTNTSLPTRTVIVDNTAPVVTVNRPLAGEIFTISNDSNTGYGNITIEYTINDNIQIDKIWYNLSAFSQNITTGSSYSNSSIVLPDGTYTLIVYANDTAGNLAFIVRQFTVNTTYLEYLSNTTNTTISNETIIAGDNTFYNSTILGASKVVNSTVNLSVVTNSTLEESKAVDSNLSYVVVENTNISGTTLENATVYNAVITDYIISGTTGASIELNVSGISVNFTNVYTSANVSELVTSVNTSTPSLSAGETARVSNGTHPTAGDYAVNVSANQSVSGKFASAFTLINPGGQALPNQVSGTRFLYVDAPNFNSTVLNNATVCISYPPGSYTSLRVERFNGTAWEALSSWTAGTFVCANTSGFSVFGVSGVVAEAAAPTAPGVATHEITIVSVDVPESVLPGETASIEVTLDSASQEPGVEIMLANLPSGWTGEAITVTLPPGTSKYTLNLTIPADAEQREYEISVKVRAWFATVSKRFSLTVGVPPVTPPPTTPVPTTPVPTTPAPTTPAPTTPAPTTPAPTTPAPTPAPKKGICGPSAIVAVAILPLALGRLLKRKRRLK